MKRQDNGSEGELTNMNNKITPTVKHFKSTGLERHLIKTIYGKKRTEERAEEKGPRIGMQRCTLACFYYQCMVRIPQTPSLSAVSIRF